MILIAIVGLLVAVTLLAETYVQHSIKSVRGARRAWDDVTQRAEAILSRDYPEPIRQWAYGMVMTTGCGCFVLNMLRAHLFGDRLREKRAAEIEHAPFVLEFQEALKSLDNGQRKRLDDLLVAVVAYDALSKPLLSMALNLTLSSPPVQDTEAPTTDISRAVRAETMVRAEIKVARKAVLEVAEKKRRDFRAAPQLIAA